MVLNKFFASLGPMSAAADEPCGCRSVNLVEAAVDEESQALLPISIRHAWSRPGARRIWQLLGASAVLAGLVGVSHCWGSAMSRSSNSDSVMLDGAPVSYSVVAETSFGRAIGQTLDTDPPWVGEHCEQWLGLPYAKPPTGSRRFAPVEPWDEAYPPTGFEAADFGPVCAQLAHSVIKGTEDCLSLNIWRPRGTLAGANLPVMLWIHGGGFIHGSGAAIVQNGCRLASKEVLVVSFNYRLGPFGFAAFRDAQGNVQANLALEDQREAMRWLHREVAAFGGDPGKITIFGQSAGAMSVMNHLVSPASAGLFRAGISESGRADAFGLEFSLQHTQQFVERAGCANETSVLDCLRNASFVELLHSADLGGNLFFKAGWMPTVDGTSLPDYPYVLFQEGKANHIPLMLGVNKDETRKFVWAEYKDKMTGNNYTQFIDRALNSHHLGPGVNLSDLEQIFADYSHMDGREDERYIAAEVLNDATYHCSSVEVANAHSSIAPVFFYRFDYRSEWSDKHSSVPGVPHCMEKPFVFQSRPFRLTEQEIALSNRMQDLWRGFATILQPGASDVWPRYQLPSKQILATILQPGASDVWPRYQLPSKQILVFSEDMMLLLQQAWKERKCNFWNNLLYSKYFQHGSRSTTATTSVAPVAITALTGTTGNGAITGIIVANDANALTLATSTVSPTTASSATGGPAEASAQAAVQASSQTAADAAQAAQAAAMTPASAPAASTAAAAAPSTTAAPAISQATATTPAAAPVASTAAAASATAVPATSQAAETTPAAAPVASTSAAASTTAAPATIRAAEEFNVATDAPEASTSPTAAAPATTSVAQALETQANALAAILASGSSHKDEYQLINRFHLP